MPIVAPRNLNPFVNHPDPFSPVDVAALSLLPPAAQPSALPLEGQAGTEPPDGSHEGTESQEVQPEERERNAVEQLAEELRRLLRDGIGACLCCSDRCPCELEETKRKPLAGRATTETAAPEPLLAIKQTPEVPPPLYPPLPYDDSDWGNSDTDNEKGRRTKEPGGCQLNGSSRGLRDLCKTPSCSDLVHHTWPVMDGPRSRLEKAVEFGVLVE
ncbi:uncharacterized protein O9250_005518 [Rhynochetos jubatus]